MYIYTISNLRWLPIYLVLALCLKGLGSLYRHINIYIYICPTCVGYVSNLRWLYTQHALASYPTCAGVISNMRWLYYIYIYIYIYTVYIPYKYIQPALASSPTCVRFISNMRWLYIHIYIYICSPPPHELPFVALRKGKCRFEWKSRRKVMVVKGQLWKNIGLQ